METLELNVKAKREPVKIDFNEPRLADMLVEMQKYMIKVKQTQLEQQTKLATANNWYKIYHD